MNTYDNQNAKTAHIMDCLSATVFGYVAFLILLELGLRYALRIHFLTAASTKGSG
jgi:hypothetical protein